MKTLLTAMAIVFVQAFGPAVIPAAAPAVAAGAPHRIVSVIPAVTEMIFAMGEGARVVGVSSYDRFPPQVSNIEHIGGLIDPNIEKILSLRPDLVIVYATQAELKQRLQRANIPFYSYEHRTLADITATVRAVGARIGSSEAANRLASKMESDLAQIQKAVAGLTRAKTLLVFGREPGTLRHVEASGGYGFLHDMLLVAGGDDVFGDVKKQSIDATTEMILARAPAVIIELRYGGEMKSADVAREVRAWDALPSVPAVRDHRIYILVGDEFVVPGPRIVAATQQLARTIHPDAFK